MNIRHNTRGSLVAEIARLRLEYEALHSISSIASCRLIELDKENTRLRARLAETEGQDYSKKSLYAAFDAWASKNPAYDLDTRLHTHAGPIEHGGYISHGRTAVAFTAFCAGAKALAAPVAPAVPEAMTPDEVLISAAVSVLLGKDWHRLTNKEHSMYSAAKEAGYVHAPSGYVQRILPTAPKEGGE